MKIKKETEYAFRIVDYLLRGNDFARAADISEAADIPQRFTKNILQKLVHKGIIESYKGIYGGYKLGRLPEEISLYDVFEVTQGPIFLSKYSTDGKECVYRQDNKWPYQEVFMLLSQELENKLRKISISSVVNGCMKEEREDECRGIGDHKKESESLKISRDY